MKRIFLTLVVATSAAFVSFAQDFQFVAGYALTTRTYNDNDVKVNRPSNGFFAGVDYDWQLSDPITVSAALYYNYSQASAVNPFWFATLNGKETEHYLEIPLHVAFTPELSDDSKIFVELGPDFSYGLASQYRITATASTYYTAGETIDQYKSYDYTRFDVLIAGELGYKINSFKLFLGYKYGLLNRTKAKDSSLHRKVFTVGVAYAF